MYKLKIISQSQEKMEFFEWISNSIFHTNVKNKNPDAMKVDANFCFPHKKISSCSFAHSRLELAGHTEYFLYGFSKFSINRRHSDQFFLFFFLFCFSKTFYQFYIISKYKF